LAFRVSKTIELVLSVIIALLIIAAAFGIIFFERFGSDSKRILANKLMSAICWTAIAW
jgi:accessory gene regulator protein AgrB